MRKVIIAKIILTVLLCVVASNKAMENYKDKNKGNIKSESDIALFVGKVVAWEFISYEFPKGTSPWDEKDYYSTSKFNKLHSMTHYGYVEDKGFGHRCEMFHMLRWGLDKEERGFLSRTNKDYIVHTLLKVHSCSHPITYPNNKCRECKVNATHNGYLHCSKILHNGHFYGEVNMRNITQEEAIDILKIVNENKARFSYWIREDFSLPNIVKFLEQLKG